MDVHDSPSPGPARLSQAGSSCGFTLVETMMAALLLAAGILLVLGADRNARLLGERGARQLRAVEAAASALDSARGGCPVGVPVAIGTASADVAVAGRFVHVETLLACGGP